MVTWYALANFHDKFRRFVNYTATFISDVISELRMSLQLFLEEGKVSSLTSYRQVPATLLSLS